MTRNPLITLLAICALVLALSAAVAGCGGDEASDEDPQAVLDETFNNDERISSGELNLSADVSAEGDQGGSFEASLSGPFQGDPDNPAALPQLDWTASASGEGGGQSIDFEGGLVVTEDNAYVEYGGEAYELGSERFAQFADQAEAQAEAAGGEEAGSFTEQFRQGCEQAIEAQGGDPAACDVDLSSWFENLTNEGTEDVEGSEAIHITGDVAVATMLDDLISLGAAVPGATGGLSPEAIQSQLDAAAEAVDEASFDVYSGVDDRLLRQLDFNLSIDPTAIPGGESSGLDSLDVGFSFAIGDVGAEQTIEPPADAKPIDELLGQFGVDPSALGGLGGLGALGGPGGGGGGGVAPGGGGDTDAYLDCISGAQTPEEINACASEL